MSFAEALRLPVTEHGKRRAVRACLARVVRHEISQVSAKTTAMQKADVVAGCYWVAGCPVGRGWGNGTGAARQGQGYSIGSARVKDFVSLR